LTLFVDVQGVPNAILEMVKARILANRKRNKERKSAATALKVQQPARRRYYSPVAPDRRPEPAAIPLGDLNVVPVVWGEEFILSPAGLVTERTTVRNASKTASLTFDFNYPEPDLGPIWTDIQLTGTAGGGNVKVYADNTFDPNNIGQNGTERLQIIGTFGKQTDKVYLVLPVSKKACIFVYSNRSNESRYHYKLQINYTWGEGGEVLASEVMQKGTTSAPEVTILKCFFVSDNAVREIAAPGALRASLGSLREAFTQRGTQPSRIPYDPIKPEFVNRPFVGGGIRDALVEIPLLYSYGMSRSFGLYPDYNRGDGTGFFTPGVYSFLSSYRGNPPSSSNNYATIKSEYLASAPTARKLLAPCVLPGSCPTNGFQERASTGQSFITFDSTMNIPTTSTTQLDPSDFRRATRRIDLADVDFSYQKAAYAWDWGEPAYCRQQLLALGFSNADLTP
jgi:hypothetical protein